MAQIRSAAEAAEAAQISDQVGLLQAVIESDICAAGGMMDVVTGFSWHWSIRDNQAAAFSTEWRCPVPE
eukprot:8212532-Prorocentrum_lima.AAC.1